MKSLVIAGQPHSGKFVLRLIKCVRNLGACCLCKGGKSSGLILPQSGIPARTRRPGYPCPSSGIGRVLGYGQKPDRTRYFGPIPDHTLPEFTRTRLNPYPTTRVPVPVYPSYCSSISKFKNSDFFPPQTNKKKPEKIGKNQKKTRKKTNKNQQKNKNKKTRKKKQQKKNQQKKNQQKNQKKKQQKK